MSPVLPVYFAKHQYLHAAKTTHNVSKLSAENAIACNLRVSIGVWHRGPGRRQQQPGTISLRCASSTRCILEELLEHVSLADNLLKQLLQSSSVLGEQGNGDGYLSR